MKKFYVTMACMLVTMSMLSQNVDRATVEAKADAAKAAMDDLKKVDTGEKAWKFDGVVGLNAAATGLVNWAAGGKNNVNGLAYAKLHLLYHKDAIAWDTNFDTEFGLTYIDQAEDAFQKSSDQMKLATKFGWEFHQDWYLTVLGAFQSQYAPGRDYITGYNPIISKWLAPSYTDISVGIDYKHSINGADFSIYLSPVAGRIATAYISDATNNGFNQEYQQAYADGLIPVENYDPNFDYRHYLQTKYSTTYYEANGNMAYRNFRAEFGLSVKGSIAYKYENLTLGTTVAIFSPYQGKGFSLKDAYLNNGGTEAEWNAADHYFLYSNNNRFFGMFDVDWDVSISYQFLKVLNVTLSTSLKYYPGTLIADKNGVERERVQFKSVLGLGIGYSF